MLVQNHFNFWKLSYGALATESLCIFGLYLCFARRRLATWLEISLSQLKEWDLFWVCQQKKCAFRSTHSIKAKQCSDGQRTSGDKWHKLTWSNYHRTHKHIERGAFLVANAFRMSGVSVLLKNNGSPLARAHDLSALRRVVVVVVVSV